MKNSKLKIKESMILLMSMVILLGAWSCSDDDDSIDVFAPVVTEVTPTSGLEGEEFTIIGRNFSATADENVVMFGETQLPIIELNTTEFSTHLALTVAVPEGATLGEYEVTVTVGDLTSKPFTFKVTSLVTLTIPIAKGGDDAEEFRQDFMDYPNGYMAVTSSDLELCTEATDLKLMVGLIFRNVEIPVGATITNAYVQFTCDDNDNQEGPLGINIWGIKETNTSAPFLEDLFNITSRPNTTASVTWLAPIWAVKEEKGPDQATCDLSEIVQEIVDQAGWASGNNMGFKFANEVTDKIHREAEAWEDNDGGSPAELIVTFSPPEK